MDDAKGFVYGIMQSVRERFANPFVGAFVISWLIWNFRLILILVGDGDKDTGWQAKISYINKEILAHWWQPAMSWLAFPTLTALFWIYALPFVLRRIAADHAKNQNETTALLHQVSESRVLSHDEAVQLQLHVARQRAEWTAEREKTAASLQDLVSAVDARVKQVEALEAEKRQLQMENEKLSKPPAPAPVDLSTLDLTAARVALGLRGQLAGRSTPQGQEVLFRKQPISWPWQVPASLPNGIALPTPMLGKTILQSTALLIFIAPNPGTAFSRQEWIDYLQQKLTWSPQVAEEAITWAAELGAFQIQGTHYTMGSFFANARLQLAALGFSCTISPMTWKD